jgi:branched-chain amino acid aminotransferase
LVCIGLKEVLVVLDKTQWVWMNGEMVAWSDAQVHTSTHTLHYGTGVFEGTRAYVTDRGVGVFRLNDHIDRLFASAAVYDMEIPFTKAQIAAATHETIAKNGFGGCYLRHFCYFGSGTLGVKANCPVGLLILSFPLDNPHGVEGMSRGIRATISSWRKFSSEMMPTTAKAAGQYINSRLAINEATKRGYDEAILLDVHGQVAEATVANVFTVRNGRIVTNDEKSSILLGITRDSILKLAVDLGFRVDVAPISVSDLMRADEVFVTGTASEVVPVREIDSHIYGDGTRGPVTRALQEAYFKATAGRDPRHLDWVQLAAIAEPAFSGT